MHSINDWAAKAARRILDEYAIEVTKRERSRHEERIAAIIATFAEPLVRLLIESRREHVEAKHDPMDDCPMLRSEARNERLGIKHECDCGADAWNEKVDRVLNGGKA